MFLTHFICYRIGFSSSIITRAAYKTSDDSWPVTVPVLNMLASLCIMGFLFSFSQFVLWLFFKFWHETFIFSRSASIPYFYFSAPDNADVNTAAKPGQETLFVDHLLKKIEEINVFIIQLLTKMCHHQRAFILEVEIPPRLSSITETEEDDIWGRPHAEAALGPGVGLCVSYNQVYTISRKNLVKTKSESKFNVAQVPNQLSQQS